MRTTSPLIYIDGQGMVSQASKPAGARPVLRLLMFPILARPSRTTSCICCACSRLKPAAILLFSRLPTPLAEIILPLMPCLVCAYSSFFVWPLIPIYSMGVLQSVLSAPVFDHVMFWAACCTAFFGFLRVTEFTCPGVYVPSCHLSLSDIQWDAGGHYRLFLKSSKTDQFHQGCTILIGPSGHQICPVAALSRYLAIRGSSPGPLFLCVTGVPLSPSMVNAWLRFILKAAGVPGKYSSPSFRIGAATSTALAGVPDHVIKILGR